MVECSYVLVLGISIPELGGRATDRYYVGMVPTAGGFRFTCQELGLLGVTRREAIAEREEEVEMDMWR